MASVSKSTLTFSIIIAVLVIALGVCVYFWKPWVRTQRTISVTGIGTIHAQPDRYTFTPLYEKQGTSSEEATKAATDAGSAVVAKLKEIGVPSDGITNQISAYPSYGGPIPYDASGKPLPEGTYAATYSLTVQVSDKTLSDKVAAYLITTGATGNSYPSVDFAPDTRSKLDLQGRQKALADAKAKADQTAKELGLTLGKVVTVSESTSDQLPYPTFAQASSLSGYASYGFSGGSEVGAQDYSSGLSVTYQAH